MQNTGRAIDGADRREYPSPLLLGRDRRQRSEALHAFGARASPRGSSARHFRGALSSSTSSGSFIIGFFATLTGPDGRIFAGATTRQFVMIGLIGGYTTFSSFSLQTLNLVNDSEWLRAGGNIVGSVVLCLVAVWLGHVARVIDQRHEMDLTMPLPRDAVLLRIFIGENDRPATSRSTRPSCSRPARCTLPAPPCCAARWASAIEPAAHHQDPAPFAGPAARHRDRGQRGEDRRVPVAAIEPMMGSGPIIRQAVK